MGDYFSHTVYDHVLYDSQNTEIISLNFLPAYEYQKYVKNRI
jgi:hypothetical protein